MSEPEKQEGGSRIKSGMTNGRKAPRWTISFLRALERTGEVRAAAEHAGIDHTTAYVRRRTHAEFAAAWEEALKAHAARREEERAEELEAIRNGGASFSAPSPSHALSRAGPSLSREGRGAGGEDLVVSGGRVKRAGHGRWSKRNEKIFFDELAATNNVQRSAKAAGVSANAVHQRRLRDPHFAAKWAAVAETGREAIGMHLIEEGRKAFDPEQLETGDIKPKVTVAEAIRIVQLNGSKKQQEQLQSPFAEQAASMTGQEVEELREKIFRKLRRMRERDMPDMIAQGWSYDEAHDQMVPPGWVRSD